MRAHEGLGVRGDAGGLHRKHTSRARLRRPDREHAGPCAHVEDHLAFKVPSRIQTDRVVVGAHAHVILQHADMVVQLPILLKVLVRRQWLLLGGRRRRGRYHQHACRNAYCRRQRCTVRRMVLGRQRCVAREHFVDGQAVARALFCNR